jgi:hypothetical protein
VSIDPEKAIKLAADISEMIERELRPLDAMMATWPADFRVLMWESIAAVANVRAKQAAGE